MKTRYCSGAVAQREEEKAAKFMVEREAVIKALREERDSLRVNIELELEEQGSGKSFFIQRGIMESIEVVKKIRGEWK